MRYILQVLLKVVCGFVSSVQLSQRHPGWPPETEVQHAVCLRSTLSQLDAQLLQRCRLHTTYGKMIKNAWMYDGGSETFTKRRYPKREAHSWWSTRICSEQAYRCCAHTTVEPAIQPAICLVQHEDFNLHCQTFSCFNMIITWPKMPSWCYFLIAQVGLGSTNSVDRRKNAWLKEKFIFHLDAMRTCIRSARNVWLNPNSKCFSRWLQRDTRGQVPYRMTIHHPPEDPANDRASRPFRTTAHRLQKKICQSNALKHTEHVLLFTK